MCLGNSKSVSRHLTSVSRKLTSVAMNRTSGSRKYRSSTRGCVEGCFVSAAAAYSRYSCAALGVGCEVGGVGGGGWGVKFILNRPGFRGEECVTPPSTSPLPTRTPDNNALEITLGGGI